MGATGSQSLSRLWQQPGKRAEPTHARPRSTAGSPRALTPGPPINHYIRVIDLVHPISLSLVGETMRSQDAKEAQRAFVEKRPPTLGRVKREPGSCDH